jgi:hypothetical protein
VKRLDGWMPHVETFYTYDDAGRRVSAVTVTESEWDEYERAWMFALAVWRESRCTGCGGNLAETTDPENEGRYAVADARCHQCTARSIAAKKWDVPDVTAPHAILYMSRLRR